MIRWLARIIIFGLFNVIKIHAGLTIGVADAKPPRHLFPYSRFCLFDGGFGLGFGGLWVSLSSSQFKGVGGSTLGLSELSPR